MIFAAVGDIHGAVNKMYAYLQTMQERLGLQIDAVLHVGDFTGDPDPREFLEYWYGKRVAPIPTWVCPGNHENFALMRDWVNQPSRMKNLVCLEDGVVTDVMGLKVGTVWGNFSYKSWRQPERIESARINFGSDTYQRSKKALHIHPVAVERLKAAGKFDVLITHDAPARIMKAMRGMPEAIREELGIDKDEPSAIGCYGFNEIYGTGEPRYHFFGHFHTFYECQAANPKVICLHCFNFEPPQSVYLFEWPQEPWRVSDFPIDKTLHQTMQGPEEFWKGNLVQEG